jgi:hypothetical protein
MHTAGGERASPLCSGRDYPGAVQYFLYLWSSKVHELIFHYGKFALRQRDAAPVVSSALRTHLPSAVT